MTDEKPTTRVRRLKDKIVDFGEFVWDVLFFWL